MLFDSFTNNGNVSWQLRDGETSVDGSGFTSENNIGRSLLGAGRYTLTVKASSAAGFGNYGFQLLDLTAAADLTLGSATATTLGNDTQAYRFSATSGDELSFENLGTTAATGDWILYGPGGAYLTQGNFRSDNLSFDAARTGEHVLLLRGSRTSPNPSPLSFRLSRSVGESEAAAFGATQAGTLGTLGQRDTFRFTTTKATTLVFDSLTPNAAIAWELNDGDTNVQYGNFTQDDVRFRKEVGPGTYTMTVRATAAAGLGNYAFRLLDFADAVELGSGDTVTATLGRSQLAYRFDATSGDEFSFENLTEVDPGGRWRLFGPDDVNATNGSFTSDSIGTRLTRTGSYVLLLDGGPNNASDAEVAFRVTRVSEGGVAAGFGETLAGNLSALGQRDRYRFTVPAATTVLVDVLNLNYSAAWELFDGEARVAGTSFSPENGSHRHTLGAGTYTLEVKTGSAAGFGDYGIRLVDLGAAEELTAGTAVTAGVGSNTVAYRLDLVQGQRFRVNLDAPDGSTGDLRIVSASGVALTPKTFSTASGLYQATASGLHYVLLEGDINRTAEAALTLTIDEPATSTFGYTLGEAATGTFSDGFERHVHRVDLAAGQRVIFDGLAGADALPVQVRLLDPYGRPLTSASLEVDEDSRIVSLGTAGTYEIEVFRGSGTDPSEYGFRLVDADASAFQITGRPSSLLTLDTPLNGVEVFQLEAVNGELLKLDIAAGSEWSDAVELSLRAEDLRLPGGFEDGYQAISYVYSTREFRDDAYVNFVLLTDEDRDNGTPITRDDVQALLGANDTVLTGILSNYFNPTTSDTVLGADFNGKAFTLQPDGAFGTLEGAYDFSDGLGGEVYGSENTVFDYSELALASRGSIWNIDNVRNLQEGDPIIASFSSAFTSTFAENVQQQIDLTVVASDPSVLVTNLDGVLDGIAGGENVTFNLEFTGDQTPQSFDLLLVRADNPGVVLGTLPVRVNDGFFYDADAVDADGDTVTYQLIGNAHGATIDSGTGYLNFSPADNGRYEFTVEASDGRGGTDRQTWTLNVTDVNTGNLPPELAADFPAQVTIDRDVAVQVTATDPDGDGLQFQLLDGPVGATLDGRTGLFEWTPGAFQRGDTSFTVRVIDGRGGIATQEVRLSVIDAIRPNAAPFFTSRFPATVALGTQLLFRPEALDPDRDPLTYSLTAGPDGAIYDAKSGLLAWTPKADQVGEQTFVLRVADGRGGFDVESFDVAVVVRNQGPTIESTAPVAAKFGTPYTYQVIASDPNGERAHLGGRLLLEEERRHDRRRRPAPLDARRHGAGVDRRAGD